MMHESSKKRESEVIKSSDKEVVQSTIGMHKKNYPGHDLQAGTKRRTRDWRSLCGRRMVKGQGRNEVIRELTRSWEEGEI
jgi:hypothetical protein